MRDAGPSRVKSSPKNTKRDVRPIWPGTSNRRRRGPPLPHHGESGASNYTMRGANCGAMKFAEAALSCALVP